MTEIPKKASASQDNHLGGHSPPYYRFYPPQTSPHPIVELVEKGDHSKLRRYGALMLVAASTLAVWHFIDTTFLYIPLSLLENVLSLAVTLPGFLGAFFAVNARHYRFIRTTPLLLLVVVFRDFTMIHGCLCHYVTWVGPLMLPLIIGAEILFTRSKTDFKPGART